MWWNKEDTKDPEIFFVRGFQRSGTNWISNLLNLHPDISCTGEFHLKHFYTAYRQMLDRKHGLLKQKPVILERYFEQFISQLIREHNKGKPKVVGDRTPMALNELLLPNKKYIHIYRDGRDILISWTYHLFRIDHKFGQAMEYKKEIFKNDPNHFEIHKNELMNNHWVNKIATSWNNRILLDHEVINNKEKHGIKVLSIKYEDLLQNTDTLRNQMYSFLGVPESKAKRLTSLTSPGFKEHNPNSHYRKGESGRWLEYFTDEQLELFEQKTEKALQITGYKSYTNG